MVAAINGLPNSKFPADKGLRSGQLIGSIDFVADAGDIANREEAGAKSIQPASASWSQFRTDYIEGLTLHDSSGKKSPLYVVPGNHDASNAIGYYKPLQPLTDKTSMVEIYNWMLHPSPPKTTSTFDYARDKVLVSHDLAGVHFVFLSIWPDTQVRAWMEADLKQVSPATPVIIFSHDPPDGDPKHFTNPNGKHDINSKDLFENLLGDVFAEPLPGGPLADVVPIAEQKAWEDFLKRHPNITAAFHGHNNWNQFYDWTGPNRSVILHTFRVDSPMKGHYSNMDETKLSFQIATIDLASRTMTVREVLWNRDPQHPNLVAWGDSTTVGLTPLRVASKLN
jgi:hypothetical protein